MVPPLLLDATGDDIPAPAPREAGEEGRMKAVATVAAVAAASAASISADGASRNGRQPGRCCSCMVLGAAGMVA